jgi:predicted nucleotidyltransferase
MNREQALETLKKHEADLRRRGVRRASLFGSIARGETRPDSDIDVCVELDAGATLSVFDYADIVAYIQSLFPARVDVSNREMLKPDVRKSAERDAIPAF